MRPVASDQVEPVERVPAAVVGAGQAGLSVSHELAERGVEHVVLEAGEIGQTWRTRRWDSFRLVSPNWLTRLPGAWYDGPDPAGFATRDEVVGSLETYAASFDAPIRRSARVTSVRAGDDGTLVVTTGAGALRADAVVVATGAFGDPKLPTLAAALPTRIHSIHTDAYRSPAALPDGGVLVVGSGQSGLQIAYELALAGRSVTCAIGRHIWVPRSLFGRDQMEWRLLNGDYRSVVGGGGPSLVYPPTPLARWGSEDFNVRTVWRAGVRLAGHIVAVDGERIHFADDLAALLRAGDEHARAFAVRIRDFARGRGEAADGDPIGSAWQEMELPAGPRSIDLGAEGIGTVVWSTGYRHDFSWLELPGALTSDGAPLQHAGASPVAGLHYVGLHRGWFAGDGTLLGVQWLAEIVADAVADRVSGRPPP